MVAGCAVAARIFSPEEAVEDIVSRIPMRMSRAKRTFTKQAERAARSGPIPVLYVGTQNNG